MAMSGDPRPMAWKDSVFGQEVRRSILIVVALLAAFFGFLLPRDAMLVFNPNRVEVTVLKDSVADMKAELAKEKTTLLESEQRLRLETAEFEQARDRLATVSRDRGTGGIPDHIRNYTSFFGTLLSTIRNEFDAKAERERATISAVQDLAQSGGEVTTGPEGLFQSVPEEFPLIISPSTFEDLSGYAQESLSSAEQVLQFKSALQRYIDDSGAGSAAILTAGETYAQKKLQASNTADAIRLTKIRIEGLDQDIERTEDRLEAIERETVDHHLTVRSIALGALGALTAAIGAYVKRREEEDQRQLTLPPGERMRVSSFRDGRTILSMVFGGMVSLVVFAMFTTREISVFSNQAVSPDQLPNYWRMAILCLVSGAFADRLFLAAQNRVNNAVDPKNPGD